jgi:hypothetical protein
VQPNKENIRKWVDALRSGEYGQTTGKLRRDDSFCCLGVACDLSPLGKWESLSSVGNLLYVLHKTDEEGEKIAHENDLPHRVADWLGIDQDPMVKTWGEPTGEAIVFDRGTMAFLSDLNDDSEWDFDQIADAIERTYLAESA